MTDGETKRIREAFETVKEAALRVKKDSPEWTQFIGMTTALGWVLDEPGVREPMEKVLKGLKDFLRVQHGISISPDEKR